MGLTLRQVEAFRATMVTGSVTHAAEFLYVSQPAISRLIADMERELGYKLFHRGRGGFRATEEARHFFAEVQRAFIGLSQLETSAHAIGRTQVGTLRIVSMPSTSGGLLNDKISDFSKENPKVSIILEVQPTMRVVEWISSQQFDLGIAQIPVDDPAILVRNLAHGNCICVLPSGHELANKRVIHANDLEGEEFISLAKDTMFRLQIDQAFAQAKVNRIIRIETRTADSILNLVSKNAGVSVLSPFALPTQARPGLEYRPFSPAIPASLGLLFPTHRAISRLTQHFSDSLVETFAAHFKEPKPEEG